MGEKKIDPLLIDAKAMCKMFSLDWSKKTLQRRVQSGFPAMRDGHNLLFNPQEVMDYFKRRRAKS